MVGWDWKETGERFDWLALDTISEIRVLSSPLFFQNRINWPDQDQKTVECLKSKPWAIGGNMIVNNCKSRAHVLSWHFPRSGGGTFSKQEIGYSDRVGYFPDTMKGMELTPEWSLLSPFSVINDPQTQWYQGIQRINQCQWGRIDRSIQRRKTIERVLTKLCNHMNWPEYVHFLVQVDQSVSRSMALIPQSVPIAFYSSR